MQPKPPLSAEAAALRQAAEVRLKEQHPDAGPGRNEADTRRLVHELQVHQIELELQNEELSRARDEVEAGLEKYSDLYDFAPVGYVTLDREGTIREANLTSASLLGMPRVRLVGRRLGLFVSAEDRPVFHAFLTKVFEGRVRAGCDLALLRHGRPPMTVRLEAAATASGRECRAVVTDVTERKRAEADRLWPAEVDARQIGQALRNVALNAREALPRIFDAYYSTKQRGEQPGLGLGLTIAQAVIQKHGGAVVVESAVGVGTTIHLYLPATPSPRPPVP